MLASFVGAAALAAAPPPAQPAPSRVAVDAGPQTDWLIVRLLEEGYAVATPAHAELDLAVTPTEGGGFHVEARGQSTEVFEVDADPDRSVAELELLHRAVDALESVSPRASSTVSQSFSIEMEAGFPAERQEVVRRQVALAVLDGRGSVAPHGVASDFTVCVGPGETEVSLAVQRSGQPCPAQGPQPAGGPRSPTRVRTKRLVAAAMQADPEPAPQPTPAPPRRRAFDSEVPPGLQPETEPARVGWNEAPLVVRGGVYGGVTGRIASSDGVVGGALFAGREPGLSFWLDVQVWPSRLASPLRVVETVPQIGMRIRPLVRGVFSLDAGVLVGLYAQRYRFEAEEQRVARTLADWSAEAAVGFAIKFWNEHEFFALLRGGRIGRERTHTLRGGVLWTRTAWRIGATAGVTLGRRLRG